MRTAEPISPAQYSWTVAASVVAGGVYFWPAFLIRHAGTQGIYTIITVTALAMGVQGMQASAAVKVESPTSLSLTRQLLPIVGIGVIFPLRAGVTLVMDGILLLLYALMMQGFFYEGTPIFALEVVILTGAAWLAIRTVSAVARSVQFWFPLILIFMMLAMVLSTNYFRFFSAVTPPTHFYVAPWINTTLGVWYLFTGADVVATLTPHVHWSSPRSAVVMTMLPMLGQGIMLLLLYFIELWVLGPDALSHLYWPMAYVFALITTRSFLIKGVGMLIIMIWTATVVLYLATHLMTVSWSISSQFPKSTTAIRWTILAGLIGIVLAVAQIIPSLEHARRLLNGWTSPAAFALDFATVPLLWILAARRQRSKGGMEQ